MSWSSRTDLCGGCRVTGIPTATSLSHPYAHFITHGGGWDSNSELGCTPSAPAYSPT